MLVVSPPTLSQPTKPHHTNQTFPWRVSPKQMVQMASYMGKLMHTEGRLASLLRDAAVRMMMRWDLILKMAEHEIIHDSPVPVPTRAQKLG